MTSVKAGLNGAVNALSPSPPRGLKGVLFDKDGTLIDFQLTWGPAIHVVIHALAKGDSRKVQAQAECLHFDLENRRFRADVADHQRRHFALRHGLGASAGPR